MYKQSRNITIVLKDDSDEAGYDRIIGQLSLMEGVDRVIYNKGPVEDWQVVTTATAWIEEVDCNSGRRRKIYSSGEIESL